MGEALVGGAGHAAYLPRPPGTVNEAEAGRPAWIDHICITSAGSSSDGASGQGGASVAMPLGAQGVREGAQPAPRPRSWRSGGEAAGARGAPKPRPGNGFSQGRVFQRRWSQYQQSG
jgi:hypothetical protein